MKRAGTTHATVVAYLALVVALSGTAVAATGGTLRLGGTSTADATTTLRSTNGEALALRTGPGVPPLRVNRPTKVERLNADRLDSLDSADLQRRVTGGCEVGAFVRSVAADGSVVCGEPGPLQTYERFERGVSDDGPGLRTGYVAVRCDEGDVAVGGGYSTDAPTTIDVWLAAAVGPRDDGLGGGTDWGDSGGYEVGWSDGHDGDGDAPGGDGPSYVHASALCLRQG